MVIIRLPRDAFNLEPSGTLYVLAKPEQRLNNFFPQCFWAFELCTENGLKLPKDNGAESNSQKGASKE